MSAKIVTEEIVTSAFEPKEELAANLAAEIQRGGVIAPDRAASDALVLVEHLRRIGAGGGADGRTTLLERGLALACARGAGRPLAHDISDEYRLHMPAAALYAPGGDPLHVYRAIAGEGTALLRPGGLVVAEMRASRADAIAGLFAARGYDAEVWSKGDVDRDVDLSALAPHDRARKFSNHRFLVARRPEQSIDVVRADGEERE